MAPFIHPILVPEFSLGPWMLSLLWADERIQRDCTGLGLVTIMVRQASRHRARWRWNNETRRFLEAMHHEDKPPKTSWYGNHKIKRYELGVIGRKDGDAPEESDAAADGTIQRPPKHPEESRHELGVEPLAPLVAPSISFVYPPPHHSGPNQNKINLRLFLLGFNMHFVTILITVQVPHTSSGQHFMPHSFCVRLGPPHLQDMS